MGGKGTFPAARYTESDPLRTWTVTRIGESGRGVAARQGHAWEAIAVSGANALKRSVKSGAGGTSECLGTFSQSTVVLRTCVLEWRLPASPSQNTSWRVPVELLEIADDCRCDLGGDAGATRRHTLCRNAETSDVGRHRAANR